MSQTIDSRVVEMRFDNKQFEAGTKQSMSTLAKLKEALKLPDSGKALESLGQAAKDIKLDGIAAGVEALERRFSTLGIVGMRVIQNITDGLMNKVHSAVSFVTDAIVSGGIKRAMNIENAHFQLQALLKDEVKVQAVMADAMESVDGTAYAYDEAAKAASQFAASGIEAGEDMLGALKGITGVAAMTNSSFEDISRVFTTVAGNGRLMGDQLLQLSSRGLNAASTLADYFKEVRGQSNMTEGAIREMVSKGQISFKDFSDAMTWAFGDSAKRANETFTGAMSNMKSALARIGAGFISPLVEQNGELVGLFNALRIKINDVKSALVFDEQRSAISGLAEVTKMSKDDLSEMFATIKTNGKVSISDLDALMKKGANATTALTKYVNGVTDGSIRASYAIKTSLTDLTNGTKVSSADIRRFVEEGKIDLSTFTSAMEEEFGNEKTLSKQFTDWFLDHVHGIVDAINSADLTKPMEIFYYWVEIVKNVVKGLLSVVGPVAKAFADVFLSFSADEVISFSDSLEKLTASLRLSERGSKNLHDAFEGVFSVVKLLVDIFFSLLGAILPVRKPIFEVGDGILGIVGAIGRGLTAFVNLIRSCRLLRSAFDVLATGFSLAMGAISKLIKIGKDFIVTLSGMEGTVKLMNAIVRPFERLGQQAVPYIQAFITEMDRMFKSIFNLQDINLDQVLEMLSQAFANLAWELEHFSFKTVERAFDGLKGKLKDFGDLLMSNEGFATFVNNFTKYSKELSDAFSWDNILAKVEKIMDVFGKFFDWIKKVAGPAFEDFNISSAIAAGGGIGIIYAMVKGAKAFERIAASLTAIPNLFGGIKTTLVAYQKELKASALLKTAAAIAVLAGALVLLSFADTERLLGAATALTVIAGVILLGVTKLLNALNRGRELNDAIRIFSKGLSKSMKRLTMAVQLKALGSAFKALAISIAIIAASIIAIGYMYKKDKESITAAVKLVGLIAAVMVGIIAGMSILGALVKGGMKNFATAALGIMALSLSLTLCISALTKLFKMEFPSDWKFKVAVLAGMLAGLGVLALALAVASRIAGGNKLAMGTILAVAAFLMVTVVALDKLFKMELPSDYGEKLTILGLIFAGLAVLMIAMGAAARLAGGAIKAGGTILALCLFLAVVVAALMVLTLIPGDKLLKGATVLGIILTTLGIALYGAGKITKKETYKSILAMTAAIGVITASLSILAMIPFSKLMKGTVALGSILLIMAVDFAQISKITNKKAWLVVAGMVLIIGEIVASLYLLSSIPWANLLTAAASMSAVLLSFAQTMKTIGGTRGLKIEKIGLFLLATTSLIPIGAALYFLSMQPWNGMLSAAVAMSAVVMAFAGAFKIISMSQGINIEKIGLFLLASLSVAPIVGALYVLATQPWAGLLSAGVALSEVLLALSGAFFIISKSKPDLNSIAAFLAASAGVGLIAFSIYELSKQPWENLLGAAASLSVLLLAMSGAMAICSLVGSTASAGLAGIGLLDLFIANFALLLVGLGAIFQSDAAKNLMSGGAEILVQIGQAIGNFVGAIVGGALSGISASLPEIGSNLSMFMMNLQPFIIGSKMLDASALAAVGILAAIIVALTVAEVINGITKLFGLSLVDIAVELSTFMVALQPFIQNSRQLNEESMKACAYLAAMILALTAAELIAGISKFFGLSGSIASFGEELSKFGPYIKKFANDVKDVKAEAVQGAASAAEIMAEVANKLPGMGGLAQQIFGTRSLAEFGAELVKFGPSIKRFGEMVKDVKPEAVQGAASAAEIMAEVATKLPAQHGLANKIFGTRSLAEFGAELVKFGPAISRFADQVQNVSPTSVTGASMAASIMTNLAKNLPSSETLWSKIFGGGQVTLSGFGAELVKFGESMSSFSASLAGVNVELINGTITCFKNLADLATYVQNTSATNITNFASQLGQIGTDSVDRFLQAFSNADAKAVTAVGTLFTSVKTALETGGSKIQTVAVTVGGNLCKGIQDGISAKQSSLISLVSTLTTNVKNKVKDSLPTTFFTPIGQNIVQGLINGINAKKPLALSTIANLCTAIITKFRTGLPTSTFVTIGQNVVQGFINGVNAKKPLALSTIGTLCIAIVNKFRTGLPSSTFSTIGSNAVSGLIQGMNSKKPAAENTAVSISNAIVKAFKDNLTQAKFKEIGANAAEGLKKGIESKTQEISKAATEAAKKAVQSAKDELKEKSPSKVMAEIGEYFSLGFANGILDQLRAISEASKKAADEAVDPVKGAISSVADIINSEDFTTDPVIRPVVDLTDVQNGAREISSLMNRTYDLSSVRNLAVGASATFNRSRQTATSTSADQNASGGNGNTTYSFNQYNYSPKSLSRSEIYRQTSNQFSAFRRAVNPT